MKNILLFENFNNSLYEHYDTSIITDEMRDSLFSYVTSNYRYINRYLRFGGKSENDSEKHILNISKLAIFKLKNNIIVYRGIEEISDILNNEERMSWVRPEKINVNILKGKIIKEKGFLSTTLNKNVGKAWAKKYGAYFIFNVPKGINVIDRNIVLNNLSVEEEIIFNKNTSYLINDIYYDNDDIIVVDAAILK